MTSSKPWQERDVLRAMYCRDEMTQQEIADDLGCSVSTVNRWLKEYNLVSKPWRSEEVLRESLLEHGYTINEVAEELDCNRETIRRWVTEYGIPERPWRDYDRLKGLFVDQGISVEEIAQQFNCHPRTVKEWVINHDFPNDFTTQRPPVETECAWCGQSLTRHKNQIEREGRSRSFCDMECFSEFRRNWTGDDHPLYSKVEAVCANCGSTLIRKRYRVEGSERQFCDFDCMSEWNSNHRVGEKHNRFKGGREKYYGPNWSKQSRRARDRDQRRCQGCGITEPAHLEELDRKLPVHHIKPIRTYRNGESLNYEEANDLENLVTLCDSCHPKWEQMAPLRPDNADATVD